MDIYKIQCLSHCIYPKYWNTTPYHACPKKMKKSIPLLSKILLDEWQEV